jgi:hypothetical protein
MECEKHTGDMRPIVRLTVRLRGYCNHPWICRRRGRFIFRFLLVIALRLIELARDNLAFSSPSLIGKSTRAVFVTVFFEKKCNQSVRVGLYDVS